MLKAYGVRENTRLDHVRELRQVLEYAEFAEAEAGVGGRTGLDDRGGAGSAVRRGGWRSCPRTADGKASLLKRHGDSQRLATLLAMVAYLTTRAVDDALDLLEVLIAAKPLARAERETAKEKLKTLPRVERAGAKLAAAFRVVFDTTSEQVDTAIGEIAPPKVETLEAIWAEIETVVPREELAAAIAALFELTRRSTPTPTRHDGPCSSTGSAPYGRSSNPPDVAPARGVREELLQVGRPAGQAPGRRGGGAGKVPSVYARPNPKYFGRRGGATWLNMINDQAAGLGGKMVAGPRTTPCMCWDVLYDRDGGRGHPADHRLHPHRRRARVRRDSPAVARKIFHGKQGQLYQSYQDGMEDLRPLRDPDASESE